MIKDDNLKHKIIELLKDENEITTKTFLNPFEEIQSAVKSLESKNIIQTEFFSYKCYVLTEEGEKVVETNSPEYIIYKGITENGMDVSDTKETTFVLQWGIKNKLFLRKGNKIYKQCEDLKDNTKESLKIINANILTPKDYTIFEKRGFIKTTKKNYYVIKKGDDYTDKLETLETEITSEMILNNKFQNLEFKGYNLKTDGKLPEKGNMHPLMKMKEEVINIFLKMGFSEMKTDKFVESSFWNFDALFQPQDHPSRDAHDTFFVNEDVDMEAEDEYIEKVKNIHQKGGSGSGSLGYNYKWNINEAKKGILRTHTTSISTRYLYKIANYHLNNKIKEIGFNSEINIPYNPDGYYKFFSIDKVFRNETVDATHLAEFHQVEGVIVGKDISLGELMSVMRTFFSYLGIHQLKFKPAYNPYTEPSMEIFGYHQKLEKWIEIGNSGIFRPEMLIPMGFDKSTRVFGWGLSLERPTMIKYNIDSIRKLVGHKVSLDFIKNAQIYDAAL